MADEFIVGIIELLEHHRVPSLIISITITIIKTITITGVEQAELRHTSHCCSTIIITIIITIMITIIITITTITITWVEQAELQHTSHRKSRVRGLGNSKKKSENSFDV